MRSGAGLAQRLAASVGAAARELAIRDDVRELEAEVLDLIADPVAQYETHPVWPALLTESGLPVELSLKLGAAGGPALRCVADVTDHRATHAGNWSRYLGYASAVVGSEGHEAELWDLCRLHLDGVPADFRSRMIHGVGYARSGWRRGSLYFRTGWLGTEELVRRLPVEAALLAKVERLHGAPVARRVEVVGYDFVPGEDVRAKAYSWARVEGVASFTEAVGSHPDLEPAREVFEAFRSGAAPRHPHPLLLQTSVESGEAGQRLFFFSSAWGWRTPEGLDRLLRLLHERIGIDLAPLSVVADAAATGDIAVTVAMVAIGLEHGAPSATFYLWPTNRVSQRRRRRGSAAQPAVDYLLGARSADGSWRDYDLDPAGAADGFVTAYVASALAVDPARHEDLAPTTAWLSARRWPELRPDDVETAALAAEALTCCGLPLPAETSTALLRADGDGPPDVTAAVLSALLETYPEPAEDFVHAVLGLVAQQRPDGGWSASRWDDDLVPTSRAVHTLQACLRLVPAQLGDEGRAAAGRAVGRAAGFLSGLALPPEPFRLALWLRAWASVRGSARDPRAARVVAALEELQQPDGRWLGGPSRRAGREDGAYVDGRSLVTTATAVAALDALAGLRGRGRGSSLVRALRRGELRAPPHSTD